jgi:hypothetical protein
MDDAAATLVGKAPSRVIDEAAPHFGGHQTEKGVAIFHRSRSFADQAQIGFVEEGCGLQRMAWALAPEMSVGDPTKLVVGPSSPAWAFPPRHASRSSEILPATSVNQHATSARVWSPKAPVVYSARPSPTRNSAAENG